MGPSEGGLLGNEKEEKCAAVKGPTEPTEVLLLNRLSTRFNLKVRAACKCPLAAAVSPLGCVGVSLCAGGRLRALFYQEKEKWRSYMHLRE